MVLSTLTSYIISVILFLNSYFVVEEQKEKEGNDFQLTEYQIQKDKESKLIDSLMQSLHNKGVFNGTVLVARKGDIIYHRSMGLANLDKKDSLRNYHPYQLASVSKPITAAAIMLLEQRGELHLDDIITKYFPELMQMHKVNIRHLLNHTSGLPDYIYRMPTWWKKEAYPNNEDFIRFLAATKLRPAYAPGYRFNYSNTNYALLASIVERITEMNFADFVEQEIFDPLGMCNSYVFTPEREAEQVIKGYRASGRNWIEYGVDYRNGITGDKGVFSTADDLLRFARAFYADFWWCNETCQAMFTETPTRAGVLSEYGLGWRIRNWDSMRVHLHYGFWNSFRTGLIEFPEQEVTFVILNNFTGPTGGRVNNRELIIRELMHIVFPKDAKSSPVLADEPIIETPNSPEQGEGDNH